MAAMQCVAACSEWNVTKPTPLVCPARSRISFVSLMGA